MKPRQAAALARWTFQYAVVFVLLDGIAAACLAWSTGAGVKDICRAFLFAVPALLMPSAASNDLFGRDAAAMYAAFVEAPAVLAILLAIPQYPPLGTSELRRITRTRSSFFTTATIASGRESTWFRSSSTRSLLAVILPIAAPLLPTGASAAAWRPSFRTIWQTGS